MRIFDTHAHYDSGAFNGDRMELLIPSTQFGYLAEGDTGRLSFQGTRFLGFERN